MELQEKSISLSKLNTNRLIYHFSGIILLAIFIANVTYSVSIPFISNPDNSSFSYSYYDGLGRIGDYPRPTNPMIDRATGYLLAGKAKSAMQNYGNFTSWEEFPAGGWINYSYLPNLSFIAGVPGQAYSSDFHWEETIDGIGLPIWKSADAYEAWFEGADSLVLSQGVFKTIVYDVKDDKGKIALYQDDLLSINNSDGVQWTIDYETPGYICLYLHDYFSNDPDGQDPNRSDRRIGLVYPWAYRPALIERLDDFDFYDYGDDKQEWTFGYCQTETGGYKYNRFDCDNLGLTWINENDQYEYYGATFQESYFTNNDEKGDWQATTESRVSSHNLDISAGDVFGGVELMPGSFVTDASDPSPLLAHSAYNNTWPVVFNDDPSVMADEPKWPGWWADKYHGEKSQQELVALGLTDCNRTRQDDDCWLPEKNQHISDMDIYMQFDDRWAHRGNQVENNIYLQTGYPLGLHVDAMAHSYGISYAEDIMFVTVKVRNESGEDPTTQKWYAVEDGIPVLDNSGEQISGRAMIMPDGTRLNNGKGFEYKKLFLGFYMDADILTGKLTGYDSGLHTNADDFMEYIDCEIPSEYYPLGECRYIAGEKLRVSMATIYDYNGESGGATDIGMVAVQLLDSPKATEPVDLDKDEFIDIEIGEPLKMTDWHWFDWFSRPGVVSTESIQGTSAGSAGAPQALNKEEINYKIMAGDTTNLSDSEKNRYFHTSDPVTDLDELLNPHFDSLEGLSETEFFTNEEDGLDCVLEMSSGPFSLKIGEQVSFSFAMIFGQNHTDLIRNAEFAQIMYNAHYQGYSPPNAPNVVAETDHGKVTLYWQDNAENSSDVVTTYTDFEGYKIYKSVDGGVSWGEAHERIFDNQGIHVGWQPYAQFDLSASEDTTFCIKGTINASGDCWTCQNGFTNEAESAECTADCYPCIRNRNIDGPDILAPWFSLGENTGLDIIRMDVPKIINGIEYQYSFSDSNQFVEGVYQNNITDGIQYSYSIVAYDIGVMPADTTLINQQIQITSIEDPGEWSQISPYQHLENSKGTTVYDVNFVTVIPGYQSDASTPLSEIKVVPNPYIVGSMMNESEYLRKLRFTKIPAQCTIKIYTVTGEFVFELNHDDAEDGNIFWDMRTINNQEVSPGLYLYAVRDENSGKSHVGKFAIVR